MRVSCVLPYSLFLSPKSVSAVRLYGDETDIRRFCIFFELPTWLPKKAQTEKVKGKCFYRIKTFMKAKTFTNINFKEGRKSARGFPAFYRIHFFSRRNPSLPYGCTATKRIFDDSASFLGYPLGCRKKIRSPESRRTDFALRKKIISGCRQLYRKQ